jgi:DeoR/GlpR family transcriptional regulator of sugar metabolism
MADSPPMVMSQRSKEIIQQLLHDGEVSVERLAKKLKTSTSTVRRELG